MSQHTPGPWDVWAMEDGADGIHATSEGILARVYNTDTNQQAANARLIAKAPEMLTLLKSCLAYFDDMKHTSFAPESRGGGKMSGEVFAPDAAWTAPIRDLLREIEGE